MKMTFLLGAFALGVTAVAEPATASILNWELENVVFDDGGQKCPGHSRWTRRPGRSLTSTL
jgi:hypothetical protein